MKLKLSPPWVTYANQMKAIFDGDPDVKILFDQEEMTVNVYVANEAKAAALTQILPTEQAFGNVKLRVNVVPANAAPGGDMYEDRFRTAFTGNPRYEYSETVTSPLGRFTYVVWAADVIQYFDDDLGDINGNATMVIADCARAVFRPEPGVYHCSAAL